MDDLVFPMKRSIVMLAEDPKAAKVAFRAVAAERAICPSCKKPVRHKGGLEWCIDHRMSEKTLMARIRGRAERRGWNVKHVGKGIAAYDAAGNPIYVSTAKSFPDLFMLHPVWLRVLGIECKKEDGEYEPGQLEYIQLLNACGIPTVPIRPSQLRDGTVDAILGAQ